MTSWYISTTGSDETGDGSLGNPYATVTKCLEVGIDGDIAEIIIGSYYITETINVNKPFTIKSYHQEDRMNTILTSGITIFNIQSNNVNINYLRMSVESTNPIITIDIMSDGTTDPTFWDGNVIEYCYFEYFATIAQLTGGFTMSNNSFAQSGSLGTNVITIYNTRYTSSIISNDFYAPYPITTIINLTDNKLLSGDYYDKCNSKGGSLTISNNFGGLGSTTVSPTFINIDYFNQFNYVTQPDMSYNPNTKINLYIYGNTIDFSYYNKYINIDIKTNSDLSSIGILYLYNNTNYFTNYGALHLNKAAISNPIINIDLDDLNRLVFKIYDNVISSNIIFHWDASIGSSILDINNNPITVGNEMYKWVDSVSNIDIVNGGSYPALLESESRNGTTYNYIKTIINTDGYIAPVSGIVRIGYTIYIVFKEDICTYNANLGGKFMLDDYNGFMECRHVNADGYIYGESINDIQPDYYNIRVWAIRINDGSGYTCIVPSALSTAIGEFRYLTNVSTAYDLSILKFGQTDNIQPTSLNIYEVKIFDALLGDGQMMGHYNYLLDKWGLRTNVTEKFHWDASNGSTILDVDGNPVVPGNSIDRWIDTISGVKLLNFSSKFSTLESEVRGGNTYNFIQTKDIYDAILYSESGIIKKGYTMYIVFKEVNSPVLNSLFVQTPFSSFQFWNYNYLGYIDNFSFCQSVGDFSTRIWAIQINENKPVRILAPVNGATTFSTFVEDTYNQVILTGLDNLCQLQFGRIDGNYPGGIGIYELVIFDGIQTDNEMISYYNSLHQKWHVDADISPTIAFNWDASVGSSILDKNGAQVTVGNPIYKWVDVSANLNMVNGGYGSAILESETYNGMAQNYIKTVSGTNGYLAPIKGIIKTGCTMYIIFRESSDGYYPITGSTFLANYNNTINASHNPDGTNTINGDILSDNQNTNYSIRIWAIRYNADLTCTYIIPLNGDPTIPNLINGTNTVNITGTNILYFGQYDNNHPTSLCLYEILVINGLQSDSDMLTYYNNFKLKWRIGVPTIIHNWDASVGSSILDINGDPVIPGNGVIKWVDTSSNIEIINFYDSLPAILEQETRRGETYNYIKPFTDEENYTGRYSYTSVPIFRTGSIMYIVFKETNTTFYRTPLINVFGGNESELIFTIGHYTFFGQPYGTINNDNVDYQLGAFNIRIWAIRFLYNGNMSGIFPINGSTSFGKFKELSSIGKVLSPKYLRFGTVQDGYASWVSVYQLVIFDNYQNNSEMMDYYYYLHQKWKVDPPIVPVLAFQWDASVESSILDSLGNPVTIGNPITRWIDSSNTVNMINAGSNPAILESESRNSTTYRYIRTINGTGGYIKSDSGMIKSGCTIYIVFKESSGCYNAVTGSKFISNVSSTITGLHSSDNNGYINGDSTNDSSVTDYSPRIWAIRFNINSASTYVVPLNGNPIVPSLITGLTTVTSNVPDILYFGQSDDNYSTSICIYEIIVYDGLQSDPDMLSTYASLQSKWGIV